MQKNIDKRIRGKLHEYSGIRLAIMFGSMAMGTEQAESDLDIAILADKPLDADMKTEIIADLAEITNRPVDLVDLKTVGEPLLGQILTQGKRLLGNDHDYAMMINRHLLDAADFLPYRQRILEERRKAWIGK
jgi:predicted nucleotidyltransferase